MSRAITSAPITISTWSDVASARDARVRTTKPVLTMRRAALPAADALHPRMPMTTIFKLAVGGSAIIAGAMGFAVPPEPLMGERRGDSVDGFGRRKLEKDELKDEEEIRSRAASEPSCRCPWLYCDKT